MRVNPIYEDEKTKSVDDVLLWARLKRGDKNALGLIYTTYFDKLYNFGSRLAKDTALLEDCVQDLFIELWNNREKLSDVSFIKLYLYTCLRRKILYVQSRIPNQTTLESFSLELSHKSHYLNQQIDNELHQQLRQVLNCLTAQQREAIFLIYYDELSYKETAEVMGLKVRTVYNLVHEGLLRLRQQKGRISFFSLLFFL